jgi:hypothetical protein
MKKKIFTLFAFLAMFMGANAANWVQVYEKSYSNDTDFPWYIMGYAPTIIDGALYDNPTPYRKIWRDTDQDFPGADQCTQITINGGTYYYQEFDECPDWGRQYFIADGIKTQLDGQYKVVAMVKASAPVTINVNMGWGWGQGETASASVSIGTEWGEVEWEYSGIGGSSCNLVAQPGKELPIIEWKWVRVFEDQAEQRPVTWQEWLTNDGNSIIPDQPTNSKWMGDAETPWADPSVKWNDQTQNYLVCAWGKERMVNTRVDENGNTVWEPFPATIEQEADGNHYFVVHGKAATTEGDAAAWDNQFWIQSPKEWTGGQMKISFKYKASKAVTVATQVHKQNPSDYLIWHAIGDINFTEQWQTFEGTMDIASDMAGTWSIAFQLNQNDKEAIDFYFDDLSWQSMVLDEGWFVASSNTSTGLEYNFDNAIEFEVAERDKDGNPTLLEATVGTAGDQSSWVNEVMISTVRGNTASFKGATIKPDGSVKDDPDDWPNYAPGTNAKIKLPAAGVWKITIDLGFKALNFVKIEGEANKEPIVINPNSTEVDVAGVERDDLSDTVNGQAQQREEEGGAGEEWDNQFFIVANRVLDAGEETVISFKYKSSVANATSSTQCHGEPGAYIHWAAIGQLTFTEDWQEFSQDFTIPAECDGKGMKSIAFNMAEIKEACHYYIKDVVWKLKDDTESLIDQTGGKNFYIKVGAGTSPQAMETGISSIVDNKKATNVTYNLAGQRVSKDYKGIVIKNGSKYIVK